MQFPAGRSAIHRHKLPTVLGYTACCLLAFALLGSSGIAAGLLFAPLLAIRLACPQTPPALKPVGRDSARNVIIGWLSRFLGRIGHPTVALIAEIDDYDRLEEIHGRATLDDAVRFVQSAITNHLSLDDIIVHLDGARFVAALAPTTPHDIETMLNTCTRIQHSISCLPNATELPVPLSVSIGFASSNKVEKATGEALLQAAFSALSEARRKAPNAVRGYSKTIANKKVSNRKIAHDAKRAFEEGEIFAYFQPQIRLSDGALSGFEALTRWHHPEHGIVSPAEFLPALEQAGMMQTLGDTMIKQATQALTFWNDAGLQVPCVGVNFSSNELKNPYLVEQIALHLDAHDIPPERLAIEVLETVIASEPDSKIIGNLAALADMGCRVDLDDFGTGYASITNIRRFSVGRIKIDRSFVTGLDADAEQANMVGAILTMAERLNVDTLAEGVETQAELDVLRKLGCQTAQGFYFSRPMPLDETVEWAATYFSQLDEPIQLPQQETGPCFRQCHQRTKRKQGKSS